MGWGNKKIRHTLTGKGLPGGNVPGEGGKKSQREPPFAKKKSLVLDEENERRREKRQTETRVRARRR